LYVENVVVKGFYAVKPYGKVELLFLEWLSFIHVVPAFDMIPLFLPQSESASTEFPGRKTRRFDYICDKINGFENDGYGNGNCSWNVVKYSI